jgi:rRNA maturation RNase YbeY
VKLPSSSIELFNDTQASLPVDSSTFQVLSSLVEEGEECSFQLLEAVVVTESRIREINREYLEHDYVTDIITFRYDANKGTSSIEGTLYCCWTRISEQAKDYDETPEREFHRVLIHGLLHLAGYQDQSEEEQSIMRQRENYYLDKFEER